MKKSIVCLIGPTAAGKTEIALKLAKKISAEIICCDSMQVYKGIDILSAKVSPGAQKTIAHHLIDIIAPSREFNAARFRLLAQQLIRDIHRRKKIPLIVAGTGLYLRALLDGLFPGPARNLPLRKKLTQQAKRYGISYLYRKLEDKDPQAAGGIHPHDLRRIIRALEVYQLTGEPISALRKKTSGIRNKYELHLFGLERPRDELYARIEHRVERMFKQGAVGEIQRLVKQRLSRTAKPLLGYKEITGYLNGEYTRVEAQDLLKKNTRHYAKRQLSWFRHEQGVIWVKVAAKDTPNVIAKKILDLL